MEYVHKVNIMHNVSVPDKTFKKLSEIRKHFEFKHYGASVQWLITELREQQKDNEELRAYIENKG